jgi:hypothetical protein
MHTYEQLNSMTVEELQETKINTLDALDEERREKDQLIREVMFLERKLKEENHR